MIDLTIFDNCVVRSHLCLTTYMHASFHSFSLAILGTPQLLTLPNFMPKLTCIMCSHINNLTTKF
jgi:hypothetical protein